MNRKRRSLRIQAVYAILICAGIALLCFFGIREAGYLVLDSYFLKSDFVPKANEKCLSQFERFVKKESLRSDDSYGIETWLGDQKDAYVTVAVYRNGRAIYDPMYSLWEEEEDGVGFTSYYQQCAEREIAFADGPATVYLFGFFEYRFYAYALALEIVLSVVIFLILYTCFIQKKIRYIVTLEREIHILETGGLEHAITRKGNDELTALADGLDQMRITLLENMQREEEAVQANYRLVVGMAHDLRTPLTALLLYLDLLHNGTYSDREQMNSYVKKSLEKATQIKRMSNQLFERFLLSKEREIRLEPPQKVQYIFEDILSDMAMFLENNGFSVGGEVIWPDCRICVVMDYVGRIMANISSNIIKYGGREAEVQIRLAVSGTFFLLQFENRIADCGEKIESTGVGVQNIRLMMERMQGRCSTQERDGQFVTSLEFSVVD